MIICESCKNQLQCYGLCEDDFCEEYEEDRFAYVYWSTEDLREALAESDTLEVSEEAVLYLRDRISEDKLKERMIEAGWDYINSLVYQMNEEKKNG